MQAKPWQTESRNKQVIGRTMMELEKVVKETRANLSNDNGAVVEAAADNALLNEIADLEQKLAAALEQGAMDALKASRVKAVEAERDKLLAQVETLTSAQLAPTPLLAAPALVECSIQYDVKAADMARWINNGWQVKHYQFVNNDRGLSALAVVMERPADTDPVSNSTYTYSVAPKAEDTPRNTESAPANEPVAHITEFIIEAPETAPSMAAPVTILTEEITITRDPTGLLKKLAQNKPIFAAIAEHGVDAVIEALDAQVYEKARAAYDAYAPAATPPCRFESKLLTTGMVNPDEFALEANEVIEVVLS